jgi:SEC-C motif/Protein of unknown function (DUF2384)
METGRNDPCSCGSGKKYKKCCLQKDVGSIARPILDFAYESGLNIRRKATEKIDKMVAEIATKPMMESFLKGYWNTPFLKEDQLKALGNSSLASQALEEQLVHAIRNALKLEGAFPSEYFPNKNPAKFSAIEIQFLKEYTDARLTYIQVREFFPEKGYLLAEDIFDEKQFKVFDKKLSLGLNPHDIICGRLVPFPEKGDHVFELLGSCRIAPLQKEMVLDFIRDYADEKVRELQKRRKLVASPEEILAILKQNPLVFFWMDMRIWFECVCAPPPSLANTDGDELIFIKARFSCTDLPNLREALLNQKNFAHQVEKNGDSFNWISQKGFDTGTLILDEKSGEARLETNSRERFRKWEKKLKTLGGLTLLSKQEETMEGIQKSNAAEKNQPANRSWAGAQVKPGKAEFQVNRAGAKSQHSLSPQEMQQLAPELEAFFTERWLKEKIPALGGITPIEAAKSVEGRKKLKSLLEYIENQDARLPAGAVGSFNVDKMRARLGMDT